MPELNVELLLTLTARAIVTGLGAIFLWNLAIGAVGLFPRRRRAPIATPRHRFAVVVPAHNEARVIGAALRSIQAQDYPAELVTVHVIADHCTDTTAEVAQAAGATVHERVDPGPRGKGHALQWLFARLLDMPPVCDAVCVLDADNLMGPGFLREMDARLSRGQLVVQAYLDSKNPDDSWIAGNHALAYWMSNRLFQLPRTRLGLSSALGGTGFMVATSLLRSVGWQTSTLTEDLEFSMQIVLQGQRVYWTHDVCVYDEKPLTMTQSWRQRRRWMQGHSACAVRYVPRLLWMTFRRGSVRALDGALYLLQPALLVTGVVALVLHALLPQPYMPETAGITPSVLLLWVAFLLLMVSSLVLMRMEGRCRITLRRIGHLLTMPLFSLTWIPVIVQGFVSRRNLEWTHTPHTRALELGAMHAAPSPHADHD